MARSIAGPLGTDRPMVGRQGSMNGGVMAGRVAELPFYQQATYFSFV